MVSLIQSALRLAGLMLAGSLLASPLTLAQTKAEPRRIYFANDDHTDYMWTANEDTYRRVLNEMLDYYLDLADTTATNPPEHRSRWHADGSFWLWNYERTRTPAEFARLIARVRDGTIGVPLNALVSCYGAQPTEAVLRGMLYAGSLERRFGLRIPMAIAMENQTLPHGLGAIWAGSGAKFSWKGICGCATKLDKKLGRPHEIYWWRGDDGSRVLMKWNSFHGWTDLGGYAEVQNPGRTLKLIETNPEFQKRWPYSVIGAFGKGEDKLKTLTDEFVRFAQQHSTPSRRIIVSNENDFFEDFARTHGNEIPEFRGSFGNEWDLYSATLSEVSARVRRAVESLRPAEALAALVAPADPAFLGRRTGARDQAWMNLGLFWEHDWTADGPIITREARAEWQRRLADQIHGYVNDLLHDSAETLGGMIARSGREPRFFVFNPLGWERGAVADLPYEGPADVHVVEVGSGREVPSQILKLPDRDYFTGLRHLRIWAAGLPSVGYKTYEIRSGKGSTPATPAATWTDGIFENESYRLRVDAGGAIVSLVDKRRGNREFARGPGFNQIDRSANGTTALENAGPVSATLRIECASALARTTRVTLYGHGDRIDIDNHITRNFGDTRQWNFTFNLDEPDVRHEEVGAILRARLTTDGGHYSPVNSRLDWLTLNHFAAMSGKDGAGITLSNQDCSFFRLGNSRMEGAQPVLDTNTPALHVLAGGMVDEGLGIYNQGGDSLFRQRFALQPHDQFDAVASMRIALEHQNPPVARGVRGGPAAMYPETEFSLVTVSGPGVLLWALKPAEDGPREGLVARMWNFDGESRDAILDLKGGIVSARRTTHLETDLGAAELVGGSLRARLEKTQLQTFRVVPAAKPAP
jgi:alpha-mannosidase